MREEITGYSLEDILTILVMEAREEVPRRNIRDGMAEAEQRIKSLITTSNKALLRRVRERGPKVDTEALELETVGSLLRLHVENDRDALWHQALNEEEAKL